jgi:hypothetical protein
MEAIRTDFSGYEGQYVAVDRRTRQVVIADRDPRVLLDKAHARQHVVVVGRVGYPHEPIFEGAAGFA